MIHLIENLLVYPDNMINNINLTCGLIFSQEVLLSLVKAGLTRENAYVVVQRNAMKVWEERTDFKEMLLGDSEVTQYLNCNDLDQLFDIEKIKINIHKIFKRIGLS